MPKIQYHIFSHEVDEWTADYKEDFKLYKLWKKENGTARLYAEEIENDEVINEDCLKSFGKWPM